VVLRVRALAVALLVLAPLAARAQSQAGIVRMTVRAAPSFDVLVWYPTDDDFVPWQMGPFTVSATHDAAVGAGRYPIVLLSHGGGKGGGSPMILGDISAALARAGFVVIAPFHGNQAPALRLRPPQIVKALTAVLADPRFKDHADPGRLGMLGYSLGGAVALSLAGAVPNAEHFVKYCDEYREDAASCLSAPGQDDQAAITESVTPEPSKPIPLRSLVLLDPFAAIYDHDGLAKVTLPVLMFRPRQSVLGIAGNALALQGDLPNPPNYQVISGGHFIFADVCSPALQASDPDLCQDPPDVNRAAVHAYIAPRIAQFFADTLTPPMNLPPVKVTGAHPVPIVPAAPTGGIR
jgi:predicted dienelactone hydrolase